jgi:hypothetical protein
MGVVSTTRRRSPRKKKALDYEHQRRSTAEYPHAHRKSTPRKKAGVHRRRRREVARALAAPIEADARLAPAGERIPGKLRTRPYSAPLGEAVARAQLRRMNRVGHNLFRRPYDREALGAFVVSLVEGRSAHSRRLAAALAERLAAGDPWLAAFCVDEPVWAARLRAWIAAMTDSP